ncbi:RimJ/RimL family protein N-acetyltransferase [Nocardioides sp. BE266]|uniref:GNAT family N-acetyltransferase n=1 Tax=Nocardioides sp. BE266 TaxID=2817725 RepID=UPI00285AF7DD|nr:GNAT family protein [Nocardioides sp. BE266]MDR7255753.1 RimJ/RimL family protein N-acetyltransferase [Nocardioides sp. BE266]
MDELTGVPHWDRASWPRTTERLTLRPAVDADAEAMFAYRSLPEVARWMTWQPPDLESWLAAFDKRRPYTATVLLGDELIGDLYLKTENAWSQTEVRDQAKDVSAEIGWCLAPEHEGRGYATEAVRDLLSFVFDGLGLRRVHAECFAVNEPSWRLMERLGMRREAHTVKDALHRDGRWYDGLTYALLAEEWRT